jgi:hypothetical protein
MYKKNLATLSGAVEEKKKFFPDTRKSWRSWTRSPPRSSFMGRWGRTWAKIFRLLWIGFASKSVRRRAEAAKKGTKNFSNFSENSKMIFFLTIWLRDKKSVIGFVRGLFRTFQIGMISLANVFVLTKTRQIFDRFSGFFE